MRVGIGYDIHRLVRGRKLIIGGIDIPYEKGLLGHSDADVLCHAIMDAILGALGVGDLGEHFPDNDHRYKDISSIELMQKVLEMVEEEGYKIVNIDSTVVAEKPKIADYRDSMKANIAKALQIERGQISIKATTTEGLGPIGAGHAIAAKAVVLLSSNKYEEA
ncbi:MAG: 2-C-methyl-D-erythritol 2,4-cyclodiphosphate synthase [Clostridiales bacterium]|nr:2-C-methyl-D-erythritol 2,4-cyclodiphosphate synthase [Clostridiales bacterium]